MRFLKANKVFDGEKFVENAPVVVIDGQNNFIEFIDLTNIANQSIEVFDGIICPGFVNAHCHLELSHLLGAIPQKTGLPEFAKIIIKIRSSFSKEIAEEKMKLTDNFMYQNGIVAVGDICNDDSSFLIKQKSKIFYHSFIELIGLNPQHADIVFEKGKAIFDGLNKYNLKGSLAAHAPYSASNHLFEKISDFNSSKNLTSTIHNQESKEELKFFMGEKSGFNSLYQFLNIDTSWFIAPKQSSLKNYLPFLNNNNWILVHNTFTTADDIEAASLKNIFWCFCPNANLYIENTFPHFEYFNQMANQICIGTDSLASNHQLDIISEMNLIKKYSSFSDEIILKAATSNGAKALGIETQFGSIITKKNTGLNLIEIKNNEFKFLKKIA